jgi:hypothetical protein
VLAGGATAAAVVSVLVSVRQPSSTGGRAGASGPSLNRAGVEVVTVIAGLLSAGAAPGRWTVPNSCQAGKLKPQGRKGPSLTNGSFTCTSKTSWRGTTK